MKRHLFLLIVFIFSSAQSQEWENHTTALPTNSQILDFKVVSENEIYAIGEPFKFAKWDGYSWNMISGLENLTVIFFSVYDSNSVFIVAEETVGTSINYHYKKWNGITFENIPSPNYYFHKVYPKSIQAYSPTEFFISHNTNSLYNSPKSMTKWDGTQWLYDYRPIGNTIDIYYVLNPTFIYISTRGTSPANNGPYLIAVMNYDGQSTIGLNFSSQQFFNPKSITWLNLYEFYISEVHPYEGDYSLNHHIWKWNSSFWVQLPDIDEELALDQNQVTAMYVHGQDELYAGGKIRSSATGKYIVGKWDGNNWSELGVLSANAGAKLEEQSNYLYAMSKFTIGADTNVALIKRIDISSNLGVPENNQSNNFQFFPNPAQDIIHFNKTVDNVSLITLDGKIIKEAKFANELRIEDLNPGLYFLAFELNDSKKIVKKLIKN